MSVFRKKCTACGKRMGSKHDQYTQCPNYVANLVRDAVENGSTEAASELLLYESLLKERMKIAKKGADRVRFRQPWLPNDGFTDTIDNEFPLVSKPSSPPPSRPQETPPPPTIVNDSPVQYRVAATPPPLPSGRNNNTFDDLPANRAQRKVSSDAQNARSE